MSLREVKIKIIQIIKAAGFSTIASLDQEHLWIQVVHLHHRITKYQLSTSYCRWIVGEHQFSPFGVWWMHVWSPGPSLLHSMQHYWTPLLPVRSLNHLCKEPCPTSASESLASTSHWALYMGQHENSSPLNFLPVANQMYHPGPQAKFTHISVTNASLPPNVDIPTPMSAEASFYSKHLSPSFATALGHQDQEAKNFWSTKLLMPELTSNSADFDMAPSVEPRSNIICLMVHTQWIPYLPWRTGQTAPTCSHEFELSPLFSTISIIVSVCIIIWQSCLHSCTPGTTRYKSCCSHISWQSLIICPSHASGRILTLFQHTIDVTGFTCLTLWLNAMYENRFFPEITSHSPHADCGGFTTSSQAPQQKQSCPLLSGTRICNTFTKVAKILGVPVSCSRTTHRNMQQLWGC